MKPLPSDIVILSAAKDLLLAYAATYAQGLPILRVHRGKQSRTLYIGVTNDLLFRINQHRKGEIEGFTQKYKINRLVYFERFQYIDNAIAREKQLKGWLRSRKIELIESLNPAWDDIFVAMRDGRWKEPRQIALWQEPSPPQATAGPSPAAQDDKE